MITAKNEVFIGLWHENFYLVCGKGTFGGGSNSVKEWEGFLLGGFFYLVVGILEGVILAFWTFLKA